MNTVEAIRKLAQLVADKGEQADDEALQTVINVLEGHNVQVSDGR